MDRGEFMAALEGLCDQASPAEGGVAAPAVDPVLDDFFRDEFLQMVHLCRPVPRQFLELQQALDVVANPDRSDRARGVAAVEIGEFVKRLDPSNSLPWLSEPLDWFRFARNKGSIVGAWAAAKCWLDKEEVATILSPNIIHAAFDIKSKAMKGISLHAVEEWRQGLLMLSVRVVEDIKHWKERDYSCALACLVNYLTFIFPAGKSSELQFGWSLGKAIKYRKSSMRWVLPLWSTVIDGMVKNLYVSGKRRDHLLEQQQTICAWVEGLDERNFSVVEIQSVGESSGSDEPIASSERPSQELVVIEGEIPVSSDRDDKAVLSQYEVLRSPLPFCSLPPVAKLFELRDELQKEFPWAVEAVRLVFSDLIVRRSHGALRLGMSPVLLVGPPGVGKTRFAQRLSELLGAPSLVMNLAGTSENKLLKGFSRGWSGNRPSRIVDLIRQEKVVNPLIILDEVDKTFTAGGNGGSVQDALLDLLEPANARRYQDVYLMAECNLSHCFYIATCNSIQSISEPLRTRFRPVLFQAPGPEHAPTLIAGVVSDLERSWGVPEGAITLSDAQKARLVGLSAREMKAAIVDMLYGQSESSRWVS
ncbi:hypothetical protein CHR62_13310 [Pusillimonas sp. NJUB218]|nr:hypothetical protein CHR62_13310 [Pusillimonas sp. NJUB218]